MQLSGRAVGCTSEAECLAEYKWRTPLKSGIVQLNEFKDKTALVARSNCSFCKWIMFKINSAALKNLLERPQFRAGRSKRDWLKQHELREQPQSREAEMCVFVLLQSLVHYQLFLFSMCCSSYASGADLKHNSHKHLAVVFSTSFITFSLLENLGSSDLLRKDILPLPQISSWAVADASAGYGGFACTPIRSCSWG